jgi:ParB-like chromosome segregation protein Spo0J
MSYPCLEMRQLSTLRTDNGKLRTFEPEDVRQLANQIKTLGLLRPFVLNVTSGALLDGDLMLLACRQIFAFDSMVPVWCVALEPATAAAARLALNSHASEWIWIKVSAALAQLQEIGEDLSLTGFRTEDTEPLLAADWKPCAVEQPKEDPELQAELF